jgi:hypothetical protein
MVRKGMRKSLPWILIAVFLVASVIAADEKKKAKLQGYDLLALPGSKVTLRAKLERVGVLGINPDLEGETLEFYLGKVHIGSAKTGDEGIAKLHYQVGQTGQQLIRVQLSRKSRYSAPNAEICLAACKASRRMAICDIDHTVADVSAARFLTKKNEEVQALAGAPECLQELSKHLQIVFVTARDDTFMRQTKDWLKLRRFPRVPVLFWDFMGKPPLSHGKYKAELIAKLKKTWPHMGIGFGDRDEDGEAYLENGLEAFIIQEKRSDDLPPQAIWVRNWGEIREILLGGWLPGKTPHQLRKIILEQREEIRKLKEEMGRLRAVLKAIRALIAGEKK